MIKLQLNLLMKITKPYCKQPLHQLKIVNPRTFSYATSSSAISIQKETTVQDVLNIYEEKFNSTKEKATAVDNEGDNSTSRRDLKAELLNATLSISIPRQRERYTSHDKGDEIRSDRRRWKKNDIDASHRRKAGDDGMDGDNAYDVNKNSIMISANIVSKSGNIKSTSTDKRGSIRSHSSDSKVVINSNSILSHSNTPVVNSSSIKHSSNKIKIPSGDSNVNSNINNVDRTHKSSDNNSSNDRNISSSNGNMNTNRTTTTRPDNKSKNSNSSSSNNNNNNDNIRTTSSISVKVPDKTDGIIKNGSIRNGNSIKGNSINGNSINGIINDNDISNNGSSNAVRMLRFKEPYRRNKTIIELEEELREKKRLLFELELRRIKNNIIAQSAIHHVNNKQAKYQLEINRLEEGMNKARELLEEGYVVAQL